LYFYIPKFFLVQNKEGGKWKEAENGDKRDPGEGHAGRGGGGLKTRQEAQEETTKADEAEEESGDELNREYGRA
jgi:hypothetical protein